MGSQQQFCLRWNNHQSNMIGVFDHLLQSETLVDVTLACDGLSLKAHKVVLSACSPFFQNLFLDNPCKHPIVILKDVKFGDLRALIDFMYRGEVNVSQDQLSALLATAETLKVKGLAEVTSGMNGNGDQSSTPPSGGGGGGGGIVGPSTIIPDDLNRRSSPSAKRKRIRIRRRSGGGGSGISDTEDEIHEISPHSQGPVELVEAKVEINENNYTPCSQMSAGGSEEQLGLGHNQIQDQIITTTPPQPITTCSMDLSPLPVTSENALNFASGSDIVAVNETNVFKGSGGSVTLVSSEINRRPNPNVSTTTTSTSLPLLNLQLPTPTPSTSGIQQNPPSGQDVSWGSTIRYKTRSLEVTNYVSTQSSMNWNRITRNYTRGSAEPGTWNEDDMQKAIDGIRLKTMTLTEAALRYKVPRNTLWYRARRSGIETNIKKSF